MRIVRAGFPVVMLACALLVAGCSSRADRGVVAGSHDDGLHIGPATPDVTSQLEAVVDVKGVDPASCAYAWSRNGQPIAGETRSVLAPSAFRKDDLVGVVVTLPAQAEGGARQLKAQVRIENAPPSVASARIAVSASNSGTVLTAVELDTVVGPLTAVITARSARRLKLAPGDQVIGVVKATEVAIAREGRRR